jgi:hypothetical protein
MSGPVVRVEGAKQLSKQFRDAGGTVKELSAAYREVARTLVGPARAAAPHRSGDLAGNVRGLGQRTSAQLAAGSAKVPYAGPIHFGNPTVKTFDAHKQGARRSSGTLGIIKPNPWLYRTADKRRDQITDAFDEHVGRTLRQHGLASPLG